MKGRRKNVGANYKDTSQSFVCKKKREKVKEKKPIMHCTVFFYCNFHRKAESTVFFISKADILYPKFSFTLEKIHRFHNPLQSF
jgi:hypothetical protein